MNDPSPAPHIPGAARGELLDRLRRHEKKWEVREIYFFTGFRRSAAYVKLGFSDPLVSRKDADWMPLCRLEWTGSMMHWRLALPRMNWTSYAAAPPPLGSVGGSPEVCVDAALEKQMGWDPGSPGDDSRGERRVEELWDRLMSVLSTEPPSPVDSIDSSDDEGA